MTVPAGGGASYQLQPGAAPIKLTEYAGNGDTAPMVINLNPAGARIWLGADSTVSPANGVPLDPGTALPWTTPGQLWAIADPAAQQTTTITVTAAIANWTPSPSAIAAQVAAQLLAQGVPTVYTEQLITTQTLPANGAGPFTDVHGYGSLILDAGGQRSLQAGWYDSAGNPVAVDQLDYPLAGSAFRVPVRSASVVLFNQVAAPITVRIYGSNRLATRAETDYIPQRGDFWQLTSQALAANTTYTLTQPTAVRLSGQCYAVLTVTGTTVKGVWAVRTASGHGIVAGSTVEAIAMPTGNTVLTKMLAVPSSGDYSWTFTCTTAGTAAILVDLLPC